jgi:hypothetical protein
MSITVAHLDAPKMKIAAVHAALNLPARRLYNSRMSRIRAMTM